MTTGQQSLINTHQKSNKHLSHGEEEIHPFNSRPFLIDPSKPRLDYAPSLSNFLDRKASPVMKMTKAHKALFEAQSKLNETADRLEIAHYYETTYNLSLSYKLVERMDPVNLEYAFRMCRLDQKMNEASTTIICCWRGYKTRKMLKTLIRARKSALLLIQYMMKRRMRRRIKAVLEMKAATLIQRYCKGHLVSKHYIHFMGDVSIDKSLVSF